jgi:hypothetical protein
VIGTYATTLNQMTLPNTRTTVPMGVPSVAPFVPANATVIINAEGDVSLTANASNQALVEACLIIDNNNAAPARIIRTWAMNSNFLNGMIASWHLTWVGTFPTDGTHDVHVVMRFVSAANGVPTANMVPGHLSVVVLK